MDGISSIDIDPTACSLIPRSFALKHLVAPLSADGDAVTVAMADADDPELAADLRLYLGKKIVVRTFPRTDVKILIQRSYGVTETEIAESSAGQGIGSSVQSQTRLAGSVVSLVDSIITDAIRLHASDIHVEPYETMLRVRYRLDGVLQEVSSPPMSEARSIISRLKIMADLDIAEKRRPQDGRIRVKEGDRTIDVRVSTLPTDFGEKVVLRILDKSSLQLDLTKLGFETQDLGHFRRMIRLPYGMILVTGPTGSGKTTTLYAALNAINTPQVNITTIEDPIEYNLPGINQTHVRTDIGLTFAAALRSILRQDPNVIMVGEIRDRETAEIAIRAALTGHLVFSTLHTNDAPSAVTRLVDMGIEPFLVASSIKMILAQRLVRRLCQNCQQPSILKEQEACELHLSRTERVFTARGCQHCNMLGYSGRTAIYEVLWIHNGMAGAMTSGATATQLRELARKEGMLTLREAAIRKVVSGETSPVEAIRETAE